MRRYGSRGSTIATNDDYDQRLMGLLDTLTMFSPLKPAAESLLYAEDYPVTPFATPEDRFDNLMEDPQYQGLLADAGMAGQGLPVTAPAIVIGAKAKNFPKALAEKFEQLEKSGLSNREAFAQTGVYRGPDGKLRYEIDDSQARGMEYQLTPQEAYTDLAFKARVNSTPFPEDLAKDLRKYKDLSTEELVAINLKNKEEALKLSSGRDVLQKRAEIKGATTLLDEMSAYPHGPVNRFVQHEELAKSYPDLMDVKVGIDRELDALGSYARPTGYRDESIALLKKPLLDGPKSTLLHELQHGIQFREGFDPGANPRQFFQRRLAEGKARDLHDELSTALMGIPDGDTEEILALYKHFDKDYLEKLTQKYGFQDPDEMFQYLKKEHERRTPLGQYQRSGGEAEARMVQKRMNYTPEERAAKFPLDDYDVPLDELIIQSLLD